MADLALLGAAPAMAAEPSRTSPGGFAAMLRRLFGLRTLPTQVVQGGAIVKADDYPFGQINPPPQSQTRWLLRHLEDAIRAADLGDMAPAARLWRAMRRDGTLGGVLSTRTDGLVRLPIRWSGHKARRVAFEGQDRRRGLFASMFPTAEIAQLAADGIGLGIGVGEMLPISSADEDEPQRYVFRRLEPEFLLYRWTEDRWYYRSIAGLLPILPGGRREDGGWWILHRPGGESTPWNAGQWPALGRAFISKEHATLHRENYSAKLAQAARAAVSPQGATEGQRQSFLSRLIAWGVNQAFDLPPGWDVKLIESNGRGYEVFQDTIDTSNGEFIVSIAGQTVTTDGGAGFANAEIHKTIRADLIQATADGLALTLNEQGILPYVNERWGAGALASAPWLEWDVAPPKEMKAQADALTSFGQAVAAINAALQPYEHRVDVYVLSTRFGVPILGTEQTSTQAVEESDDDEDTGAVPTPIAPLALPGPGKGNPANGERAPRGENLNSARPLRVAA